MSGLTFTVHGDAQPAGSKRSFHHKTTGRIVVMDANKNSRPWKTLVAQVAGIEMRGHALLEGPLILQVRFLRVRPKAHYNTKGELSAAGRAASRPATKPDATKLIRGVEDALTGIVWRDDAQVCLQMVEKAWADDGGARCEVFVAEFNGCECDAGDLALVAVESCPIHGGSVGNLAATS